tara:strand:- start:634 stop:1014 length:381 start_codon:yes stop_codon:yes gene_type:complete
MKRKDGGYILFEVIIAVTIFSLAIVGLMRVLDTSLNSANYFACDTAIRYGLQSILTEARHRDLGNMILVQRDEAMGVEYRTEVEPLQLASDSGGALSGLYILRATATYDGEQEVAEVWIYEGEDDE